PPRRPPASPAFSPPRPAAVPGEAIADPTPSRVVTHATVTKAGLAKALNEALPRAGEGSFPFIRGERQYTWQRDSANIRFTQGRIGVDMHVDAFADLPLKNLAV